jgi:hypothetical protein
MLCLQLGMLMLMAMQAAAAAAATSAHSSILIETPSHSFV